jgi:histidinol dehydrogenase
MMNYYRLDELSDAHLRTLRRRAEARIDELLPGVRSILEGVRRRGDAALLDYTARFDGVQLTPAALRVAPQEFVAARNQLLPDVRAALERAAANIRHFHERQMPQELWFTEVGPGILAGEKVTPITSVGLYVPRGKGAFPSVLLMLALPATIARVPRIVICTPPGADGSVDAACLFAAELCEVTEVYRVGGAQALAALAYGTATIPAVRKVVGPGSGYVAAAKRLLYGTLDVGLPAGPSEAILLADGSASPDIVARDLLIEAEHGSDSSSLLLTDSEMLARQVLARLPDRIAALAEPRRTFCQDVFAGTGGLIVAANLEQALKFVNDYAPEHLEVLVQEPLALLPRIKNAGEILLGPYTPICVGNYCLGTNAILPTGGFAHTFSAVSVFDFLKRSGVAYLDAQGYGQLHTVTRRLAEYEGFPAHAQAVTERALGAQQSTASLPAVRQPTGASSLASKPTSAMGEETPC